MCVSCKAISASNSGWTRLSHSISTATLVQSFPVCYWCKNPEETLEEYYHLESQYETVHDISIFVNQRRKSPFKIKTSCKWC